MKARVPYPQQMKIHAAAVTAMLLAGCGGGGSGSPAGPSTPPPPDPGRGTFTLSGAGYNSEVRTVSNAGGNLVFCRQEPPGPNTIWIRLAQSSAASGENSPHIDIDLCNFAGTSTYTTLHSTTTDRTCSQGASLGIWWHDGAREFASQPGVSGSCTVSVTRGATTIDGAFTCDDIPSHVAGSNERLNVRAGSFTCSF